MTITPVTLFPPEAIEARAQEVFEAVERALALLLPNAQVHHIGATAVPGSLSKGDVDVAVLVSPQAHATTVLRLQAAGYCVEADTLRTSELCMLRSPRRDVDLALQVVATGSQLARDFLRFRDVLRSSAALLTRYNAVKAANADAGMDAYRAAKSRFIVQVLSESAATATRN